MTWWPFVWKIEYNRIKETSAWAENTIAQLKAELNENKDAVAILTRHKVSLNKEKGGLVESLSQLQKENQVLRGQMRSRELANAQQSRDMSDEKERHQAVVENLEAGLSAAQDEILQRESGIYLQSDEIRRLISELSAAHETIAFREKELEKMQAYQESLEAELTKNHNEAVQLSAELLEREKQITETEETLRKITENVEYWRNRYRG